MMAILRSSRSVAEPSRSRQIERCWKTPEPESFISTHQSMNCAVVSAKSMPRAHCLSTLNVSGSYTKNANHCTGWLRTAFRRRGRALSKLLVKSSPCSEKVEVGGTCENPHLVRFPASQVSVDRVRLRI